MNYERVPDQRLNTLKFEGGAFQRACKQYADVGLDLVDDLLDYLVTGFVVSRPWLFALAKPIDRNGKRGWFIRYATGDLAELITVLPCPAEFICFCRENDGVLRIIKWEAFCKAAEKGWKLNVKSKVQISAGK